MIELPEGAPMRRYQEYVEALEAQHGWTTVDHVHNCFLMGEEVGELFKAVRRYNRMFEQSEAEPLDREAARQHVAEELVDVFNYLVAVANRVDVDLEAAFRAKNLKNQTREWT
jgi:NTP pyrophosphatase (non-canonical NTP hydrolase)